MKAIISRLKEISARYGAVQQALTDSKRDAAYGPLAAAAKLLGVNMPDFAQWIYDGQNESDAEFELEYIKGQLLRKGYDRDKPRDQHDIKIRELLSEIEYRLEQGNSAGIDNKLKELQEMTYNRVVHRGGGLSGYDTMSKIQARLYELTDRASKLNNSHNIGKIKACLLLAGMKVRVSPSDILNRLGKASKAADKQEKAAADYKLFNKMPNIIREKGYFLDNGRLSPKDQEYVAEAKHMDWDEAMPKIMYNLYHNNYILDRYFSVPKGEYQVFKSALLTTLLHSFGYKPSLSRKEKVDDMPDNREYAEMLANDLPPMMEIMSAVPDSVVNYGNTIKLFMKVAAKDDYRPWFSFGKYDRSAEGFVATDSYALVYYPAKLISLRNKIDEFHYYVIPNNSKIKRLADLKGEDLEYVKNEQWPQWQSVIPDHSDESKLILNLKLSLNEAKFILERLSGIIKRAKKYTTSDVFIYAHINGICLNAEYLLKGMAYICSVAEQDGNNEIYFTGAFADRPVMIALNNKKPFAGKQSPFALLMPVSRTHTEIKVPSDNVFYWSFWSF